MLKLSSIEGNRQWLDGGSMFGNAPRAVWQKWTKVDEQGRIPLACRCLLIESKSSKILCETGIGNFFEPKLANRFGVENHESHQLLENLKQQGIDQADIDYVILSHLHFDHAGGLLPSYDEIQKGNDQLLFPKAKYIVGKKAWDRATTPHFRDRASFLPDLNKKLQDSGRLIIIDETMPPKEISDFISFYISSGHTPGQMHTVIKGNDGDLIFAGDLIPGAPWVHLPITMGYDRFPEKLIEEKQQLYQDYDNKKLNIFFTHDSQYSMGTLIKNEKGRYLVDDLKENLNRLNF